MLAVVGEVHSTKLLVQEVLGEEVLALLGAPVMQSLELQILEAVGVVEMILVGLVVQALSLFATPMIIMQLFQPQAHQQLLFQVVTEFTHGLLQAQLHSKG
jgi:predicted DNA repair protein MutK